MSKLRAADKNEPEIITNKKELKGRWLYLVKWKEFEISTWEPASHLQNSWEVVEDFEAKSKKRRGSFSLNDEIKEIKNVRYDEQSREVLADVSWKQESLVDSLYPLKILNEKCPTRMCELYYTFLRFSYKP